MKKIILLLLITVFAIACQNSTSQNVKNPEKNNVVSDEVLVEKKQEKPKKISDISTPEGYVRVKTDSLSYAFYLQNLPIKQENNIVYLFDGTEKYNQTAQFAVLDIDVGKRDLQQCADAVMRVRAEYLFENEKYSEIHFNFLSDGKPRYYTEYAGNDRSYTKFRKYMDYIFSYANTASLIDEMEKVEILEMQIGDIFIQKRRPYGHAITVVDMAENENGKKVYMLTQSYMPAQEIHILKNPADKNLSPWYRLSEKKSIETPEWTFYPEDLRRFK